MRELFKNVLRSRAVGVPIVHALRAVGRDRDGWRIAKLCGYRPRMVRVHPAPLGASFVMLSARGKDQFAEMAWGWGWEGVEHGLPRVFMALARGARMVYDIGANTGLYSLFAASAGARVRAFEPFPPVREWLERNALANGWTSRIAVEAIAVSDRAGVVPMYVPAWEDDVVLETTASLEASFHPEHGARHGERIDVRCATLDELVGPKAERAPGLIKIDVEGHERAVLAGARRTLRELRPFVIIEVLDAPAAERLRSLVEEVEYAPLRCRPGRLTRTPDLRDDGEFTNQVLCPRERLADLGRLMEEAGVGVEA